MIPDRQFCEYNYEKERRRSFAHSQSEVSWRTYNNPDNYIISLDEWILNPDKEPTYSPEKERRHFRASFNTTSEKLNTLEISDGKKEMKVELFSYRLRYQVKQGNLGIEGYYDQKDRQGNNKDPYLFWSLGAVFGQNKSFGSTAEIVIIPHVNVDQIIYFTPSISEEKLSYTNGWGFPATTAEAAWQVLESKDSLIAQHPFYPQNGLEMVDLLEITRQINGQKALFTFRREPQTRPITREFTTEEIIKLNRVTNDQITIEVPPFIPNIKNLLQAKDSRDKSTRALDALEALDVYLFPLMQSFTINELLLS